VARTLPGERIIYFGDTARLPYGNKSRKTVTRLAVEALRFLEHFRIKAFVVACNSASALAMPVLAAEASVPVLGVVEAGARQAAAATRTKRVAVIGTRATVASRCYEQALAALAPGIEVASAACPLFVPLVEEGWTDHPVTARVAGEYLQPLRDFAPDTLILGCTHYPLLKGVIQTVMGDGVTLIDSGEAMALELQTRLADLECLAETGGGDHRYFVSDQAERFHDEARRFLGDAAPGSVSAVDQSDLPWFDRGAAFQEEQD
jgi:glutamate racemase